MVNPVLWHYQLTLTSDIPNSKQIISLNVGSNITLHKNFKGKNATKPVEISTKTKNSVSQLQHEKRSSP